MPRKGSMPARPEKRAGMLLADVANALVGQLEAALDVDVAGADGDQQRALDARPVHPLQVVLDGDAAADLRRHAHLGLEGVVEAGLAVGDRLGREQVADDVDRAPSAHQPSLSHSPAVRDRTGMPAISGPWVFGS